MQPHPKAYIFDLDGLLLDTEPIYDLIFAHYARLKGVSESDITTKLPALRQQMYGKRKEDSARLFLEGLKIKATVNDWLTWRQQNEMEFFANAIPKPGAAELVEKLQAQGQPVALATSSDRQLWETKSRNHPWLKRITVVVTGDEVSKGKPAPDIFLTAAARLQYDPEACLVFEDALSGVEAALAANMHVVFVPTGELHQTELQRLQEKYPNFNERVQILDSLENFQFSVLNFQ
jgi:pseudouridine-5'-monophosphatase